MSSQKNKKFIDVINRLLSLYGYSTQTDLANHFGVTLQAVQQWAVRGVPGKYIATASKEKSVSVEYLESGAETAKGFCFSEDNVREVIDSLRARIEALQLELNDKRKQIDSLERDKNDLREERDFFRAELKKDGPTQISESSNQPQVKT